jgi:hypothetical protein
MGMRARLSAAIGAAIVVGAALGASDAAAEPDWSAAAETVATDHERSTPTTRPSAIGDDLIYDFVGPNVADGPKQQNDGRGYSAGHFQLELDGKP